MDNTITENNLKSFERYLYYNEKAGATVTKYILAVRRLAEYLGDRQISKNLLLKYRDKLQEKYKAQTVNGVLSAINAWLCFMGKEKMRVKLLKIQRQVFLSEEKELNMAEYKRLLGAARKTGKERLYMIMLTLCGTGIRISELKYITVESARAGRADIHMKGKSRTVLLQKKLCRKLLAYARIHGIREGQIICTKNGKPVDRSNICRELKRLCKSAGINPSKVFPHNFRHLFARKFYEVEKNLAYLADILGHSNIETTRIYVAVSAKAHEHVLEKMQLVI